MLKFQNTDYEIISFNPETLQFGDLDVLPVSTAKRFHTFNIVIQVLQDLNLDFWVSGVKSLTDKGYELRAFGAIVFKIVVKYENINVSNSKGHTAFIRDLYLYWNFTGFSAFSLSTINVWRQTYCRAAASSGYLHSHSTAYNPSRTPTYCIGPTSNLSQLRQESSQAIADNDSDLKFILARYFIQLSTSLNWESLDGVPYIRIKSIFKLNKTDADYSEMYEELLNIRFIIDSDWKVKVLLSEQDKSYLIGKYPNEFKSISIDNETISSYEPIYSQSNINSILRNNSPFEFKGEILTPKIEGDCGFTLVVKSGQFQDKFTSKIEAYANGQIRRFKELLFESLKGGRIEKKSPINPDLFYPRTNPISA